MTAESASPAPAASMDGVTPADVARYAAAIAAADDPELYFGPAATAFSDMRRLLLAGDRLAAGGASLAVQDHCLALCASEAVSARAADDKTRFLAIMVGWAWPRVPAVGSVLNASRARELTRWGPSAWGSG